MQTATNIEQVDQGYILSAYRRSIELSKARLALYAPHQKQLTFHDMGTTRRHRAFFGGNRTGKTVAGAAEFAMHLSGNYPQWWEGVRFDGPVRAWAAGITGETTRDIVQRELIGPPDSASDWGTGYIPAKCLANISMRRGISNAIDTLRVKRVGGGWSELQFKSYDQGYGKFQGTSKHLIWLDEEPPETIFNECRMRILDTRGSILLTLTPLLGMTDVCFRFLKARDTHTGYVIASWSDNPHLSKDEIAELRKNMSPHEREAREKGIPTLGSGKIYPFPESGIVVEPFAIPESWARLSAIDFGWNITAGLWAAHDRDTDTVYLYSEHYLGEQEPIIHAHAWKGAGSWIPCVGDPAGKASSQIDGQRLIQKYAEAGLDIIPADNSVQTGILEVYQRISTNRLKVFGKILPNWLEEFRLYHRDDKGKVVKEKDHLMDDTRYLCMEIRRAKAKIEVMRPRRKTVKAYQNPYA